MQPDLRRYFNVIEPNLALSHLIASSNRYYQKSSSVDEDFEVLTRNVKLRVRICVRAKEGASLNCVTFKKRRRYKSSRKMITYENSDTSGTTHWALSFSIHFACNSDFYCFETWMNQKRKTKSFLETRISDGSSIYGGSFIVRAGEKINKCRLKILEKKEEINSMCDI